MNRTKIFDNMSIRINIRMFVFTGLLAACLMLLGCAAGPDYNPVRPEAPEKWHTGLSGGLYAEPPAPETLAAWWRTLNDPELESLEQRAVKGNLDLKLAGARVREARALRGISRAALFPTLDAAGSATKARSSKSTGTGRVGELYSASFDAGWELDIFGKARRSMEAAQADLEASQEDLHDVMVTLLAEVAVNYVEVRTFQARLAATRANIRSQQESYDLNRSRFTAGTINELAVAQSLYNLEQTRSLVPTLETGLAGARHRLAVLLGETPGTLDGELADNRPIPVPPVKVAVGVPADALRRRPDIRRAERELAAATARIGEAAAELYPQFRLSGTIGLESLNSEDFLESASRFWGIGPGVSWNIFDAGAIRNNIKVQTARQEQALIRYRAAVLAAQEEVENVLVAYAREQVRRRSLKSATDAARRAYELAKDQYDAGLVDFSEVLDAQRSLESFEDQLAVSEGRVTTNMVRLYKALGGGWQPLEPAAASSKDIGHGGRDG